MSFFSHLDPLPGIGFHTLFKPASVADYLNYPSAKMTFFATKFTKNLNLEILHFKNKGKIMLYCIYFNLLLLNKYYTILHIVIQCCSEVLFFYLIFLLYIQIYRYCSHTFIQPCVLCTFPLGVYRVLFH